MYLVMEVISWPALVAWLARGVVQHGDGLAVEPPLEGGEARGLVHAQPRAQRLHLGAAGLPGQRGEEVERELGEQRRLQLLEPEVQLRLHRPAHPQPAGGESQLPSLPGQ